jgi:hypothetical protein
VTSAVTLLNCVFQGDTSSDASATSHPSTAFSTSNRVCQTRLPSLTECRARSLTPRRTATVHRTAARSQTGASSGPAQRRRVAWDVLQKQTIHFSLFSFVRPDCDSVLWTARRDIIA